MKRTKIHAALAAVLAAVAFSAAAQQLYRWTDETGRVHITDTPPPGSARDVQKKSGSASPPAAQPQQNFELAQAMKEFPVSLYTAPNCSDPCNQARAALNKRGIPFTEIVVADRRTHDELRQIATGKDVPVLVVGRSVHEGFQQEAFDTLLDAARYPRAGVLPARAPTAPGTAARPAAEEPRPTGPYAPRPPGYAR